MLFRAPVQNDGNFIGRYLFATGAADNAESGRQKRRANSSWFGWLIARAVRIGALADTERRGPVRHTAVAYGFSHSIIMSHGTRWYFATISGSPP